MHAGALLEAEGLWLRTGRDVYHRLARTWSKAFVTLDIRVYAQASEARVGHLRTAGGEREVDLIVERADGRVVAFVQAFGASMASLMEG